MQRSWTKIFLLLSSILWVSFSFAIPSVRAEEPPAGEAPTEGKYKINLAPFNFSLLKRGRVVGQVDLTLVLELDEGRDYEEINSLLPRIRSDISIALTDFARQQFSVDRPIDPDLLTAYLTPFLDYRLGKDRVEIYVQQAMISPK